MSLTVSRDGATVCLDIDPNDIGAGFLPLTPAEARTLAADLLTAATEADPRPAIPNEIADLRARVAAYDSVLAKIRPVIAELAETPSYGAPYAGMDPHDFTPDPECCLPEELAAHAAALEAGTRPAADEVHGWGPTDRDIAYTSRDGEAKTVPAGTIAHFSRTPWGIGTMTLRDPAMAEMLAELERLTAALAATEGK